MNKLTSEAKKGISIRVITAVFIALYLVLAFVFASFSSPLGQHGEGWVKFLPTDKPYITLIFAILFILSFAWLSYFIAKELCIAFLKTNKPSMVITITIILLVIQLTPTICYLPYVYYPDSYLFDSWWQLILIYACTSIGTALIAYGFLYKAIKHAPKSTKFNIVMFPLVVIGIAWSFSLIYYLTINHEWSSILIILIGVCACDIFAFFGGSLFGKHKLAPNVSPKKTWEGAIIGSVIAAMFVVLFVYLIGIGDSNHRYLFFGVQTGALLSENAGWWILIVVMAIVLVVSAVLGDLLFSLIKRKTNIKDFGTILPGHGGLLDRMDSFLFTFFTFGGITIFISLIASIVHKQDCVFPFIG
ncbi:MAG: phosphatidate cytidylyltransferase [Mycoplasmataceae bacterium]|nr:phosphatidate cytidylyltransferase [Mycoplasmataceae bacterium]